MSSHVTLYLQVSALASYASDCTGGGERGGGKSCPPGLWRCSGAVRLTRSREGGVLRRAGATEVLCTLYFILRAAKAACCAGRGRQRYFILYTLYSEPRRRGAAQGGGDRGTAAATISGAGLVLTLILTLVLLCYDTDPGPNTKAKDDNVTTTKYECEIHVRLGTVNRSTY